MTCSNNSPRLLESRPTPRWRELWLTTLLMLTPLSQAIAQDSAEPGQPPEETTTVTSEATTAQPPTEQSIPAADAMLEKADQALKRGEIDTAVGSYARIIAAYPQSPQALAARRSLDAIRRTRRDEAMRTEHQQMGSDATHEASRSAPAQEAPPTSMKSMNLYSSQTNERLSLSVWEKLDFVATSFSYGLSAGVSFAAAINGNSAAEYVVPLLAGGAIFGGTAIHFAQQDSTNRGDLPLTLGIAAYAPASVFFAMSAMDVRDEQTVAWATAITATLAYPLGLYVASELDLDPGDTQLVRDAGFWGALLPATFAMSLRHELDESTIAAIALGGLYTGVTAGFIAARQSEISLERVRVLTWGGYAGGILGTLGAIAMNESEPPWAGMAIGASLGLVATGIASGSIDVMPADATVVDGEAQISYLTPTAIPTRDESGHTKLILGVNLASGRF